MWFTVYHYYIIQLKLWTFKKIKSGREDIPLSHCYYFMLPIAANPKYVMIDPITTTDLNLDSKIHRKFCVSVSSGLVIAWKNTIHPTTIHPMEKMMNVIPNSIKMISLILFLFILSSLTVYPSLLEYSQRTWIQFPLGLQDRPDQSISVS